MKTMKPIMMAVCLLSLSVLAVNQLSASSKPEAPQAECDCSKPTLDCFKQLAGTWVAVDENGKPTETVMTEFRVTSAGHTVLETIFPGTSHEMLTVYHQDGDQLVLTHYCGMGNQPRMKAVAGPGNNTIAFVCTGVGNLKDEREAHMHEALYTFVAPDRVKAVWKTHDQGNITHVGEFDIIRVKR